jgi:hypothetical protein
MFRLGMALAIVGVAVAATGILAVGSVSLPLPGGLHFTLFLPGAGALVALIGAIVMAWSRLRSGN